MLTVCLLLVCLLCGLSGEEPSMSAAWTLIQDQLNGTLIQDQLNGTLIQDQLSGTLSDPVFSGRFGFRNVSGVRCFSPELEPESRIIGGQEAWANSWPWQVSLHLASMAACGGAVIGPSWVLSAAHCFRRYHKASLWTALAGKHDLDNPQEARQQLVGVASINTHPAYEPRSKRSDIALLRLRQPLVFGLFVRPIDLWMKPLTPFRKCSVTGWGSTRENGARVNRLQEVNVTILPPRACEQYYRGRMRPSMFCAGRDSGGADACQGDSGGPLSCFTGGRFLLAGLVSWGVGCGRARRPGVYSLTQSHAPWIHRTMGRDVWDAEDGATEESSCGAVSPGGGLSVAESSSGSSSSSWPWQVSLQAGGRHYCSGVLIHHSWVLTARDCRVRALEDTVALGVRDLRFSPSEIIPVDRVFNRPADGSAPPTAGLSLLRLRVPATFGAAVSAVCVPDDEEDEDLDGSWSCVTAGWGASSAAEDMDPDRLHHVGLTLMNRTACRAQWGGLVTDAHVCAWPAGAGACMGDAGAPLLCRKRGSYFLFGVVTWGSRRCDADKPAVFSRISDHLTWITEVTGVL
ncbi:ovochymase-1 [Pseudoliparis swirei]|uniref:ovochymase-1 n=1 Tax=Pseudoliparis swirei TaxID=2059687 RepID=UPI0024BE529E|nr:ovochymase-1 [Pseudoliparis swirei]